jgi:hypothetical protein
MVLGDLRSCITLGSSRDFTSVSEGRRVLSGDVLTELPTWVFVLGCWSSLAVL